MPPVKVFLLVDAGVRRRWLRRYRATIEGDCGAGCPHGYHNAMALVGDFPSGRVTKPDGDWTFPPAPGREAYANDPRWPTHAPCGYAFGPDDEWQVFERQLYRRHDGTGELMTLEEAPVGACWDAEWHGRRRRANADGRYLCVRCPTGHEWDIDSRASNCTLPHDDAHRCWVRHGSPEDGTLHVDKNGLTCGAGAGSIVLPGWHGFLHNGHLVSC